MEILRTVNPIYTEIGCGGNVVNPTTIINDALVPGRLVWVDSCSAGKAQSIGGGVDTRIYGRYTLIEGTFDFDVNGGVDGGGCITATSDNAALSIQPITAQLISGQPEYGITARYGSIDNDNDHRYGSCIVWHRLNNIAISSPLKILDALHIRVLVNPDYTLSVEWHELHGFINIWTSIQTSTFTVPANDNFALEYQWGISPLNYDRGGFFLARRYTPSSDPITGVSILNSIGVRTRGEFSSVIESTVGVKICVPKDSSISGAGFINPDGSSRQWLYETYFSVALPVADGDTIQSDISYGHTENYGLLAGEAPELTDPQPVGMNLVWGDADRWKNVIDINHSANKTEEELRTTFASMGAISASTSHWANPPVYPTSPDVVTRNSLRGSALDLYHVAFNKTHTSIIALGPFALVGWRVLVGQPGGAGGGFLLPWVFSGPKPYVPNGGPFAGGFVDLDTMVTSQNLAYRISMKLASGTIVQNRGSVGTSEWRALPGFQSELPGVIVDSWNANALPQVGIQGDFTLLDAIEGLNPSDRWIEADIGLAGMDIAYRKRVLPTITPTIHAPIAVLKVISTDLPNGLVTFSDASVDFNDGEDAIITGVTLRSINWGDGSPAELVGTGPSHPFTHHYLHHGNYNAVLTATNAHGITNTSTQAVSIPIGSIVVNFSAEVNVGDVTRFTFDFTDLSSNPTGTIVSRAWNFGDGHTSTSTNPTHQYTTPGNYTVTLSVVDDSGQNANTTSSLTVPASLASDCTLSAGALADTVNVQGDDFNGGNPPLPAYANTAAFAAIAWDESPYRGFYDGINSSNNNGSDFSIASDKLFNGGKTLKFIYGPSTQGGWFSVMSDDANSETFVTQPGRYGNWSRIILSGEVGLVNDPFGSADGGLVLLEVDNTGLDVTAVIRGGTIHLVIESYLSNGVSNTPDDFDTGISEDIFFQTGFGEAILWFGADPTAHTVRGVLWAAQACTLSGVMPIADRSRAAYQFSSGDNAKIGVRRAEFALGRMASSAGDKAGWIGLAEMQPGVLADNPYGVGLP